MSNQQLEPTPEQEFFDENFIVFEGSSTVDVSHAKQLWNSLSLHPPLESRLVSADIRQKLPMVRPHRDTAAGPRTSSPEPSSVFSLLQRQEDRQRYLAMAERRKEILALLRTQKEQRIEKELLCQAHKPKMKGNREKVKKHQKLSEQQGDKETVERLQ